MVSKEQSLPELLAKLERVVTNLVKHSDKGSIGQSEAELALEIVISAKQLTTPILIP